MDIRRLIFELNKGTIGDILQTYKTLINEDYILAEWFTGSKNWGDSLSPVIIGHYSKKKPLLHRYFPNIYKTPVYMAIGSILQNCKDKNIQVWGTGFISNSDKMPVKPRMVCAVRGPRTRDLLIKQGISCPKIFGDPALLFPEIYKPTVVKKYKLGIIPHYVDASSPILDKYRNDEEIKIIDVTGDIYEFVQDVCKCKSIASSSLHGCIVADAYRIPSLWIKISNNIVGKDFKFYDYYESIGQSSLSPHQLVLGNDIEDVVNMCIRKEINLDLKRLKESCPFIPGVYVPDD